MKTIFQRGQSMVEFAVVLPFFFIICFGVMVMSFMFADYVQVQYEARSIVRACSVLDGYTNADKQKVVDTYNNDKVRPSLFLYQWSFDTNDIKYTPSNTDNGYWTVTLESKPKDTDTGLWGLAFVLINKDDRPSIPSIKATCTMYSENDLKPKNDTNNNPGR